MNRTRTTEQFLNDIHGDNLINFRLIKDSSIKYNAPYNTSTIDYLNQLNAQGFNVYFVVNSGGDNDDSINSINSVFVDFDCPKENKQHPSKVKVDAFKREQMDKINKFKFKPSYIVETRNGLHVYWLVNNDATVGQFKIAQARLIAYFDSDKSIKNPSRVMRLPNYYWTKDMSQKYMVTIKECNLNRYDYKPYRYNIDSIINELPEVVVDIKSRVKVDKDVIRLGVVDNNGVNNNTSILYTTPKLTNNGESLQYQVVGALMKRDSSFLKQHYNLPHVTVTNNDEYMNYIRSIDLRFILGVNHSNMIKCIFHNDTSPSTSIFRADDGASLYKCHSESCGITTNIVGIVERLGNFNSSKKAHDFIREILNVEMAQSEWQKEQVFNLDQNIKYLSLEIKEDAPELYNVIRHQIPYLIKLNVLAKELVANERITDNDGNVLFFTSIKDLLKIAELSENSSGKIGQKNVVLQYHLLLNKLSDAEIPEDMLSRARAIQIERGFDKRVNFYSIPSYTANLTDESIKQAHKWKANAYTVKGASREMFYRKEGAEVSEWLYPQHSHVTNKDGEVVERTTTVRQDEIQIQMVKVIMELIEEKGYCTEKDILARSKISQSKAQRYIKVNLPEILDSYNLIRVRANKELKQQLGITGTGSPFLLLKNK